MNWLKTTLLTLLFCNSAFAESRALSSWSDGETRQAIIAFVEAVTKKESIHYLPEAERIAVFDNDGTLWAEQPLYVQLAFAIDRIKTLAPENPQWQTTEPFKSIISGDLKNALSSEQKIIAAVFASHSGMTTTEFEQIVKEWIANAKHPTTGKLYTEMIYQPMLELLNYLRSKGFSTYIVSGGGVEFMRPWVEKTYGIPPEKVIGSRAKLKFELRDDKPVLVKLAEVDFIDDGPGKPVAIQQKIGRQPIMAFGNSDGDLQMLQWTCPPSAFRFCLFVHHTDSDKEWAYDRSSPVGRLDKGLEYAHSARWTIVDMKRDWKTIFP
jgi:phosphoglycolate phosphatase-like HAD superfamily hydrolase